MLVSQLKVTEESLNAILADQEAVQKQIGELRSLLLTPAIPVSQRQDGGENSELEASRAEISVPQNARGRSYANATSKQVSSVPPPNAGSQDSRAMTGSSSNASSILRGTGVRRGGTRAGRGSVSRVESSTRGLTEEIEDDEGFIPVSNRRRGNRATIVGRKTGTSLRAVPQVKSVRVFISTQFHCGHANLNHRK